MNWRVMPLMLACFLSSCTALPTERQLVGTWTAPEKWTRDNASGVMISHSKQMRDFRLAANHTFTWSRHGRRPTEFGHWDLSGRYLITWYNHTARGRDAGFRFRDKITKVTPEELVYIQSEDSGPDAAGVDVHLTRRW